VLNKLACFLSRAIHPSAALCIGAIVFRFLVVSKYPQQATHRFIRQQPEDFRICIGSETVFETGRVMGRRKRLPTT
jgi:hypothetical protein